MFSLIPMNYMQKLKLIILIDLSLFLSNLLFTKQTFLLFVIYFIASFIVLALNHDNWKTYFLGLSIGLLVEISMVHFKVWIYPVSNVFGVPIWIFLGWGILTVSTYRAGLYLQEKRV